MKIEIVVYARFDRFSGILFEMISYHFSLKEQTYDLFTHRNHIIYEGANQHLQVIRKESFAEVSCFAVQYSLLNAESIVTVISHQVYVYIKNKQYEK